MVRGHLKENECYQEEDDYLQPSNYDPKNSVAYMGFPPGIMSGSDQGDDPGKQGG